jgi:hypothetical protein
MAANATSLAYLKPWKPGQSGNPAGRPKGSRGKLEERFLADLLADWQDNGAATLAAAREKDPVGYVKVAASLMPKQIQDDGGLEDFNRDELRLAIDALRSFVALRASGEPGGEVSEPAKAE